MKLNKLPDLFIKDPLGTACIYHKSNKALKILKWVVGIVLSIVLVTGLLFLNIKNEERLNLKQKMSTEQNNAISHNSGVVFDTTTSIIQREGKIPESVARQYAVWIYESAAKYAVDPLLILSIMSVESNFNYKAVSPTGPVGLLQIAASHHKEKTTAAELFNPEHNISVGTQIIKEYTARSSSLVEALLRYNGSLGSAPVYATKVIRVKSKYEDEIMKAMTL